MPDTRFSLKRLFRQAVDFLLYSNVFIALCASSQAMITYQLLHVKAEFPVLALLFCSTIAMYNFSMLISKPENYKKSPHRRVRWIYSHYRLMITMSIIAIISLLPLCLFLSLQGIILIGFTAFLSICYSLPLFSINDRRFGLRNIPGLKLFLIALIWSMSTVLFPIVEASAKLHAIIPTSDVVILTGMNFLFIAAITIPFDVRDLFQDRFYNLKTLPVVFGAEKSIWLAQTFLAIHVVLLFVFSKGEVNAANIGLTLAALITAYTIHRSPSGKTEYYYFFFLDGTMIMQLLLVLLCQWIGLVI